MKGSLQCSLNRTHHCGVVVDSVSVEFGDDSGDPYVHNDGSKHADWPHASLP